MRGGEPEPDRENNKSKSLIFPCRVSNNPCPFLNYNSLSINGQDLLDILWAAISNNVHLLAYSIIHDESQISTLPWSNLILKPAHYKHIICIVLNLLWLMYSQCICVILTAKLQLNVHLFSFLIERVIWVLFKLSVHFDYTFY